MSCRLKHLAVAAAIVGLATQVRAGYFPGSTDFEGENTPTNWTIPADGDIVEDATVPQQRPASYIPSTFVRSRAQVLSVDNDVATPIVCDINAGAAMPASTIYADVLVKGYPLAYDAPVPEVGNSDKLLVYTRVNAAGTDTNLCVLAKSSANSITNEAVLTSTHIGKDEWHRIIIEALTNGSYKVYCDTFDQNTPLGTYYPINAVSQGSASMSSVAFAGSGYLDDVILSDLIPEQPVHTLTWDTGFDSVSYVVGNVTNSLTPAGGSLEFQAPVGSSVTLIGNTGYYDVTTNATAAAGSVLALNVTAPTGLAKFYPGASGTGTGTANDPYTIPDYPTLVAMQIAVANDDSFRSACYEQTDDITLGAAWPGIGIQNGKDIYTTEEFNNGAFSGTYDGGNHTISGFQMVGGGLDYCGFFNSTYGATIQNLKIQYAGGLFAADTSKNSSLESGATFVGVAKNSTLRNLTTVAGTVSCDKGFGGIVGYLTSGSLVDSCTNNVNMTSLKPNKCGGIAMITQGGSAVTICNCQNNGSVAGSGEIGSAVGYIGLDTTISNFESTVAYKMFQHQTATVTLQGTIKGDATVLSYSGNNTPGLNVATVDNGVATFVADDALVLGNTYKVMNSNAAYAFVSAGSITFDESLASPTVTADAAYLLSQSGSGTVTYTATLAVAEITGGAKYATLQAAVDAATAGDTVTVLADCTVSTPLSIAKNLTIHNDHTITGAVNYAICIGATVSFEGSGKIERASGITGSAFCVGANETTRGAITAGTTGTLNFTGLTVCGGSGGNLIKLENGTVIMNGGVLKDGLRGIKADADAGSYTSAIVINGGTITNCSAYAVYASAESATGTATITINGGVIAGVIGKAGQVGTETITIPGTSTAKFNADQTAFCESGYETVLSDGWYVVQAATPAYPTYLENADATIKGKYDTWKGLYGADTESAYEAAFLLNADPENLPVGAAYLKIASITQVSGGWELEIVSDAATLTAESNNSGLVGNGYLAIVYAADLATLASGGTAVNLPVTVTNGHITVTVTAQNAKFMKAKLSCLPEPQN